MKRFTLILAGSLLLTANVAYSQAIDDRAVVPVSVTLNSILRLNVTSGGNIEFNFNTLEDFHNGINNLGTSAAYQTRFTVASSVNWDVLMYAEDAHLMGTDNIVGIVGENTLELNNIGYQLVMANAVPIADFDVPSSTIVQALASLVTTELVGYNGTVSNAGDIARNSFVINWRAGTGEGGMNTASILEQGVAADRYSTNVFLVLQPAN